MTRFEFLRSRLLAPPPRLVTAIPLAIPFVLAPTMLRLAVDRVVTGTAFVAYYPFILIAALLLGWRAAAIVTTASAVVANFLFMEPRYELFADKGDTLGAIFFAASSSLIIALAQTLRGTMAELQAAAGREAALNGQLHHLNSELQHRVKNILTIVQGLASQTFRGDPSSEEAVRTFRSRLHALAEAQDVLTSGRWEGCRLPELAVRALAPFNGQGAVTLRGPACALPEATCVPLVLALHELGTNAVKYGALSSLDGGVHLAWSVVPAADGEGEAVVMEWTEKDGPEVQPPVREGLGSRLLRSQRGLDEVILAFQPAGVTCRIVIGCGGKPARWD